MSIGVPGYSGGRLSTHPPELSTGTSQTVAHQLQSLPECATSTRRQEHTWKQGVLAYHASDRSEPPLPSSACPPSSRQFCSGGRCSNRRGASPCESVHGGGGGLPLQHLASPEVRTEAGGGCALHSCCEQKQQPQQRPHRQTRWVEGDSGQCALLSEEAAAATSCGDCCK